MVSDAWGTIVAEAREFEGSGGARCAPGSVHDAGVRMYAQQHPSFLRAKDIEILDEVCASGAPDKLVEHVNFLNDTLKFLEAKRPSDAKTLRLDRLPYLKQVRGPIRMLSAFDS